MEPNIRDYFSIIVLTYKKNQTNRPPPPKKKHKHKTKPKNCYNKSVNGRIRGSIFNMHRLKCCMFFNLAIKQRDTCIRNIYLKCYIFREILGVSFIFSYIINQKRKMFVNHCPLPILQFSPKLCTCIYIKNIMWNGGLGTRRERCCRDKKNLNASRGRYHICTEINRSLGNWLSIFV